MDQALADKTIDQPVYDNQQRYIEKICATGDEQTAMASLFDAAIARTAGRTTPMHARSIREATRPD
ncbi:hypothetical protein [Burkholderia sp. Bp8998]|uniref:hypothetical protein n=1 Tax=Burkholderia sp. Bp8998 TaxID=2184557 RepID=UPI000F5AC008|nr:hypothetical protein [Burkholderia sp. Bp8998]RQS04903.1 hypothetical protein DIE06_37125 [Burkholderia sp. Bp8998]